MAKETSKNSSVQSIINNEVLTTDETLITQHCAMIKEPNYNNVLNALLFPGPKDRDLQLAWLQKEVGGPIEILPITSTIVMCVNKEGKLKELETNFKVDEQGVITVGTVVFVGVDLNGNLTGLTDEDFQFLLTKYGWECYECIF